MLDLLDLHRVVGFRPEHFVQSPSIPPVAPRRTLPPLLRREDQYQTPANRAGTPSTAANTSKISMAQD